MITRRMLLEGTGATLAASSLGLPPQFEVKAAGLELSPKLPNGTRDEAVLESLPGKKPLIKLSYRPPNYKTPIEHFRTGITANDVFFVRYPSPISPPAVRGSPASTGSPTYRLMSKMHVNPHNL